MGQISVEETQYHHWGKCIKISNGTIELIATVEVGPRIIRLGVIDGPNEFREDLAPEVDTPIDPEFTVFGEEGNWHIRGGHRLWVAPEVMPRTYYPDNKPVAYEKLPNGVRLTPPVQHWTHMQQEMEVTMEEDGTVTVVHRVTNRSPWPIECAPWAVSAMEVGGLEAVPQSKKEAGLLPNRSIVLWTYSDMADSRVKWGTDYIILRPNAKADHAFKVGVHNEYGYAAYFNHGNLFIKEYSPVEDETYPDEGCSYETYTDSMVCEMETLAPLKVLEAGATAEHTERWRLIPNVPEPESAEELKKTLSQYMK